VPSIVADYRASATIDVEHDQASLDAGDRLAMPVAVLQQDWGAQLGYDMAGVWRSWAPDLEHRTTQAGHFMAEETPGDVAATIEALVSRTPEAG
jgi:haloacetate dehalogenase